MAEKYVSNADNHGISRAKCWHKDQDCGCLNRSKVREVTDNEIEWHDLEACKNCASEERTDEDIQKVFPDRVANIIESVGEKFDEEENAPKEYRKYKKA